MTDHPMTYEQVGAFLTLPASDVYDGLAVGCDIEPESHLHVARHGAPGTGLLGRVVLASHTPGLGAGVVVVSASEARKVAAELLNMADELDGNEGAPLRNIVSAPAVEAEAPGEIKAGDTVEIVGNTFDDVVYHNFDIGSTGRVNRVATLFGAEVAEVEQGGWVQLVETCDLSRRS